MGVAIRKVVDQAVVGYPTATSSAAGITRRPSCVVTTTFMPEFRLMMRMALSMRILKLKYETGFTTKSRASTS